MLEAKHPMFEYMIRRVLDMHDLDSVEGQVAALEAAVPIVATIRDDNVRPAYVRLLARWLATDLADRGARGAARSQPPGAKAGARAPVARRRGARAAAAAARLPPLAARRPGDAARARGADDDRAGAAPRRRRPDPPLDRGRLPQRDPRRRPRRGRVAARHSSAARAGWSGSRRRCRSRSRRSCRSSPSSRCPSVASQEEQLARTAKATVASLVDRHLLRQKADLVRQLQRTEGAADADRLRELRTRLVTVEADRRTLRGA